MINGEQQYIKRVAAKLHCSSEKKKVILSCVQDTIAEHELRDTDYAAIAAALGEPENMAQEYADVAVPVLPSLWRRVITVLVVAQVIAVILFGAYIAHNAVTTARDLYAYDHGYYVETLYVGEAIPVESGSTTYTVDANNPNE